MPWVEVSEKEIARRWLRENCMYAVEYAVMEEVAHNPATASSMVYKADDSTYRASPMLRELLNKVA